MSYLIDSNIIIDFQKEKEPELSYFTKATTKQSFVSVISYSEVILGIKNYPGSLEKLESFDSLLSKLSIEILGLNKKEALIFTDLKLSVKHNPLHDFDLLIAATAIANNLTLVTGNFKHFTRISNLKIFPERY